jgi:hypothetical protein
MIFVSQLNTRNHFWFNAWLAFGNNVGHIGATRLTLL